MSHLNKREYEVRTVPLATVQGLVRAHHYSRGGANTATYRHGLFHIDRPADCLGAAWWIPPTKAAAIASYDGDWRKVLALTRLVLVPDLPTNAASYLLARSTRLIKQDGRFACLVTDADEWRGHTGLIYKAAGWEYIGLTAPEAVWVDPATDRMVARKRGPVTLTKQQMLDRGYEMVGRFSKHKYRKLL